MLKSGEKRDRWAIYAAAAGFMLVAAITAMDKDRAPAAPSRFALTVAVLMLSWSCAVAIAWAWRRRREIDLRFRFRRAPTAMRDTLMFLLHERALGRRWRLTLATGAWLGLSLSILARWPQLAALGRFQSAFGIIGVGCALLLLGQPLYMRRHLINAHFLKRYLRQQAEHVGFVPAAENVPDTDEAVAGVSPEGFRAGGFDWTLDDFCKNAIVFGQPGTGKTVAVLNSLLEGVLAASTPDGPIAGLILDAKGAWSEGLPALCERLGRGDDLILISPDAWPEHARTSRAAAWNPLDTADDALEVASRIITTMKLAGGVQTRDTFFLDAARVFIRHALVLTRAAFDPEPPSFIDIHALCAEPLDAARLYESHIQTLVQRYPEGAPPEVETAVAYFESEWRTLPDRHLAGVRSAVTQLVDDFTIAPVAEMISGKSTIRISDIIDQGKILYVHLPLAGRERVARILTNLIKLEFQREILRRPGKRRPSVMLVDEFQTVFSSGEEHGDSDAFERSRESRHANIVAVQNLSSLLKKTTNRNDVTNFVGLCAVKIFLRNTEAETNQFASNVFGERSEIIVSASEAARLDGGLSRSQTSYSRSTKSIRIVPPDAFVKLSVPMRDDPAQQHAESIVHLGSRDVVRKLDLRWRVHPLTP